MNPRDDIIPATSSFIEENVGELVQVFHEVASSDDLHIDIHHGRSPGDVRYQWLFTSGMSRKPMNVPVGCDANPFAELMMCLPAEWPLTADRFREENNYWPVRLLKMLARYPHENNTWLCGGHSVSHGKAFAANTKMSSVILLQPQLLGAEPTVHVRGEEVLLWAVCPLYEEERAYKQARGSEALTKLLANRGINELLNPARPCVLSRVI